MRPTTRLLALQEILLAVASATAMGQPLTAEAAIKAIGEGVEAYDTGNSAKALQILTRVEQEGKANEVVYYFLGLIAHDQNDFPDAEKLYRKALEINPSYSEPYSDLAAIRLNQGAAKEAKEFAAKAVELDPKLAVGFQNLAAAELALGERDLAKGHFLAAARLDPNTVTNQGTQMIIQYNDFKSALFYFSIVLEAAPNHPMALLNAGLSHRELGNWDEAKKLIRRGYENTSVDNEVFGPLYGQHFRILLDDGKFDEILRTATERAGEEFPSVHYFKALAFYRLKRQAEFENEAKRYFILSDEKAPASLTTWAEEALTPAAER